MYNAIPIELTENIIRKLSYAVFADMDNDGIYEVDITNDVESVDYIDSNLEIKSTGSTIGKPSVNEASITLFNNDGKYSPSNSNNIQSIYNGIFGRNTKVRIIGGFIDANEIKQETELFSGVITNIKNKITLNQKRVTLKIKDFAKFAQKKKCPDVVLFDKTLTDSLEYIINYTYGEEFSRSIQRLHIKYPVIELTKDLTVWQFVQKICEACDGKAYFENGTFKFITPHSPEYVHQNVSQYTANTDILFDLLENIDEESIINKWTIKSNPLLPQVRQVVVGTPSQNTITAIDDYKTGDNKNAVVGNQITLKSQDDDNTWIDSLNVPLVDTMTYSDLVNPNQEDIDNMNSASIVKVWDKVNNKQLTIQDIDTKNGIIILKESIVGEYDIQVTYQYYNDRIVIGRYRWYIFDLDNICQNIEIPIIKAHNGYNSITVSSTVTSNTLYFSDWEILEGNKRVKFKLSNNLDPITYIGQQLDIAYINQMEIYGQPCISNNSLIVEAIDLDTINEFENSYSLENNYIINQTWAKEIVDEYLFRYKSLRSFIEVTMKGIPQLQLMDRITIQENVSGLNQDFIVNSIKHSIKKSGWKTSVTLESTIPIWSYNGTGITVNNPIFNQDKIVVLPEIQIQSAEPCEQKLTFDHYVISTVIHFTAPSQLNIHDFMEGRVIVQEWEDTQWGRYIHWGTFTDAYLGQYKIDNLEPNKKYKIYVIVNNRKNYISPYGAGYEIVTPNLPDPRKVPPQATGLMLTEIAWTQNDGTAMIDVEIKVDPIDYIYFSHYYFEYSKDGGLTWNGQISTRHYATFKALIVGVNYLVRAYVVSTAWIKGAYVETTIIPEGKTIPPQTISSIIARSDSINRMKILLEWQPVSDPDLKGYLIKVFKPGETIDWDLGGHPLEPYLNQPLAADSLIIGTSAVHEVGTTGTYSFLIKAIDTSGNYSASPCLASITVQVTPNTPTDGNIVQEVTNKSILLISWTGISDKDLLEYEVKLGDNWNTGILISKTKETLIRYSIKQSGQYNFMVRSRNIGGFYSMNILNINKQINTEPSDVTNFIATQYQDNKGRIKLTWDAVLDTDLSHYQIRKGVSWDDANTIIIGDFIANTFFDYSVNSQSEYVFWIKAFNNSGKSSLTSVECRSIFNLTPTKPTNISVEVDASDKTLLTIRWDSIPDLDLKEYEIRQGLTWNTANLIGKTKETFIKWKPELSTTYKILLRAKNNSDFLSEINELTYSAILEPLKVVGFSAYQNGANIAFMWNKNSEPDVVGYEIREGSSFDNGSLIATGITTNSYSIPIDTETTRRYHIKAINRAGKYSVNAVSSLVTVSGLLPKNVIYSFDEIELSDGSNTNTQFAPSAYNFSNFGGRFNDYPTLRFSDVGGQIVLMLTDLQTQGEYLCVPRDMGKIITANITCRFVSTVLLLSGVIAKLQYRISMDGINYSEWVDFVPLQTTFRFIQFKVNLFSNSPENTPEVNILTVNIDVPDIDRYNTNDISIAGTQIWYGYTYWSTPSVTAQAIGENVRAIITQINKDYFTVKVVDTITGNSVTGQVSWIARGH